MQIDIAGITVSYNYITTYLFIIYVIKHLGFQKEPFDFTIARPLFLFYLALMLLTFIPRTVPFFVQFSLLRAEIMNVIFLPIIIWQTFRSREDLESLNRALLLSAILMCIYGLYCFITTSNPYVTYLAEYFDQKDYASIYYESSRSGFTGRVQSTTIHAMTWSALIFMFIYYFNLTYDKQKSYVFRYLLLSLLIINMLISGTRSGLIALSLGLVSLSQFLSAKRKILVVSVIMLLLVVGIDTSIFGNYKDYADSIIGVFDSQRTIKGSSLYIRLDQLFAVISMVENDIWVGNGFSWTQQLLSIVKSYPGVLAFESIIFVQLADNGLFGVLIWSMLFFYFLILNRQIANDKSMRRELSYLNAMVYSYAFFIIVTGICQTWVQFILIYAIMLRHVYIMRPNKLINTP